MNVSESTSKVFTKICSIYRDKFLRLEKENTFEVYDLFIYIDHTNENKSEIQSHLYSELQILIHEFGVRVFKLKDTFTWYKNIFKKENQINTIRCIDDQISNGNPYRRFLDINITCEKPNEQVKVVNSEGNIFVGSLHEEFKRELVNNSIIRHKEYMSKLYSRYSN